MGIFNTILFVAAALAAVMTILSTIRAYAMEFVGLRTQLVSADTARLIVWRIVETQRCQDGLQIAFEPKVRSRISGPMLQGQRVFAPLASLAA